MSKPIELVATLVVGQGAALDDALATQIARAAGLSKARRDWLAPGEAVDLYFFDEADALFGKRGEVRESADRYAADAIVQPVAGRRKALLLADMDSTMIAQECIDELADLVGLRGHIAAITERAMRGEIEFESALTERVALLEGVRLAQIETLLSRLTLTPGARTLVQTMRAHGAYTALVSGGFTLFTQPVAARIGFDESRANRLEVAGDALTGRVLAPILGREAKRATLAELRTARGLDVGATLAIGDGANDLDMLREAGLGVAYRAKPKVAQAAHARIDHTDLTALLYAQGYRRAAFACSSS